jgi:hypothetical protein
MASAEDASIDARLAEQNLLSMIVDGNCKGAIVELEKGKPRATYTEDQRPEALVDVQF